MPITDEQLQALIGMVTSADRDDGDCGSCFHSLAEFAEAKLSGAEIPEALRVVQKHLEQCPCCCDEFNALVDGLRAMEKE